MFDKKYQATLSFLASMILFGCNAQPQAGPPASDAGQPPPPAKDSGGTPGMDSGTPGMDAGAGMDTSPGMDAEPPCEEPVLRANVHFRGVTRIQTQFMTTLDLTDPELCSELGRFGCVGIHYVALGGTDPYVLGLYERLPFTTATTPLAVDRLALHGCRERVDRDLADVPNALIFQGFTPGAGGLGGVVIDPDAPEFSDSIETLYKRALQRLPSPEEQAYFGDLYREIEVRNDDNPGRSWAILSCYTVLTTVESLFY